jgi:hypothetical protein
MALTEQPRKGDRIAWTDSGYAGTVMRCEGNLCWLMGDDGNATPFIWRFEDCLNQLATVVPVTIAEEA